MAVVLDASAIAEYLIGSTRGLETAAHIGMQAGHVHVPHLAAIEAASALRGWVRGGVISLQRAQAALNDLQELPARRWPGEFLLPRIWELRDNLTVYDASYVALAEHLDASLLTADSRMARGLMANGLATCPLIILGPN